MYLWWIHIVAAFLQLSDVTVHSSSIIVLGARSTERHLRTSQGHLHQDCIRRSSSPGGQQGENPHGGNIVALTSFIGKMLALRSLAIALHRHTGKRSVHLGLALGATHPSPRGGLNSGNCDTTPRLNPIGIGQLYPSPRANNDGLQGPRHDVVVDLMMAWRPTAIAAATSSFIQDKLASMWNDGLYLISTLKRRRKMMNKHKLRKRRKKNRMSSKK